MVGAAANRRMPSHLIQTERLSHCTGRVHVRRFPPASAESVTDALLCRIRPVEAALPNDACC